MMENFLKIINKEKEILLRKAILFQEYFTSETYIIYLF